ncbi:MAG: hypothetical protein ACYDG6_06720 [Thermincolia bacterium]
MVVFFTPERTSHLVKDDVYTKTEVDSSLTNYVLQSRIASETQTGIVELATPAETTTGTDITRAVHPAGLKVELDKKWSIVNYNYGNLAAPPILITGSAVTSIQFTGLNANLHGGYVLVGDVANSAAVGSNYSIFVENDTNAANYTRQFQASYGATTVAGSDSSSMFFGLTSGEKGSIVVNINIGADGQVVLLCHTATLSSNTITYTAARRNATVANITQIDIISSVASAISVNSRFRLYRRM